MNNNESSNRPLLSICIPTFNRAQFLKENLEGISEQIKPYMDLVEVLVYDNASSDETKKVVEQFMEENVFYFRQPENKGFQKNLESVINASRGKYLQILGDDDLLSCNFLDIFIPILKEEKYSLIHFNRLSGDSTCSNNILHDRVRKDMKEELRFGDFLLRVMSSPNFMSSIILKKEIWERGENGDYSKFYGYEWLGRIFLNMDEEYCLYYYMPMVIMRNPARTWTNLVVLYILVGMTNLFRELDTKRNGILDKWHNRLRNSHFYDYLFTISEITRDQQFYRNYKEELLSVCRSKKEQFLIKIFLSSPLPKLTRGLYLRLLLLIRFVSGELNITRKTPF